MPVNYEDYPENWFSEIRPRILSRANGCCEKCKARQFSVYVVSQSGEFICRFKEKYESRKAAKANFEKLEKKYYARYSDLAIEKGIDEYEPLIFRIVVLTIAHLDQNRENNSDENLKALCQRCHVRHDAQYRKQNKARKHGQYDLFIQNQNFSKPCQRKIKKSY